MAVTENDRLEMHLALRTTLGDKVAETMMNHLPPTGWADVARRSDVDRLDQHMNSSFKTIESRLTGMTAGLRAMGTINAACFAALFTILATR